MSLFVDSNHITQADMAGVEPEIPEIASANSLSLETVASVAWDEAADELRVALASYGDSSAYCDPVIAAHLTGIAYLPQLVQVVIGGEETALRRWLLWRAVAIFYRAASTRAGSDRYEEKFQMAEGQASRAWRGVLAQGIPLVFSPLPCPGAIHEAAAGTFGQTNLSPVSGGSGPGGNYEVAITWTSGQYVSSESPQNGESGPSAVATITLNANELLRVDISGLAPPHSLKIPRGAAFGPDIRQAAAGWNIYAGAPGGPKFLQNVSPIPISTAQYTLPGDPVLAGSRLFNGQVADVLFRPQRYAGRA